jgi:hypothetical protein
MSTVETEKRKTRASRRVSDISQLEPAREKRETIPNEQSGKRKAPASRRVNDESLSEPATEEREIIPGIMNRMRTRSAFRSQNIDCTFEPTRKRRKTTPRVNLKTNGSGVYPGPSAGVHGVESNDSSGEDDDDYHSAYGDEEVPGQTSADNCSDGNSAKCSGGSDTLSTKEGRTPDTCAHTFCDSCPQECINNDNTCPVDRRMFHAVVIRCHPGGDCTSRIAAEPPRRQYQLFSQTIHTNYILKTLLYAFYLWAAWTALDAKISDIIEHAIEDMALTRRV